MSHFCFFSVTCLGNNFCWRVYCNLSLMQNTIVTMSHCIPHTEHPVWGKVAWTRRKWLSSETVLWGIEESFTHLQETPNSPDFSCQPHWPNVEPGLSSRQHERRMTSEVLLEFLRARAEPWLCQVFLSRVSFQSIMSRKSSANVFVIIPSMISTLSLSAESTVSLFIRISPVEMRRYFLVSSCEILAVCWVNETVRCAFEMSIRSVDRKTGTLLIFGHFVKYYSLLFQGPYSGPLYTICMDF